MCVGEGNTMEAVFLGTSSMVPTKERNHSAVFLDTSSLPVLFDCGEGTQRQIKIAGIRPTRIRVVLITHWHGDHVLGLPGFLQTLSAMNYEGVLTIVGPRGTARSMDMIYNAFHFHPKMEVRLVESGGGVVYEDMNVVIEALPLRHSVACLGFSFREKDKRNISSEKIKRMGIKPGPILRKLKEGESVTLRGKTISAEDVTYVKRGKKVSYIVDTEPCDNAVKLAEDSDVMICEATYSERHLEKGEEYGHMTAKQAALLANKANAKKLVLTHFSQRYTDLSEIEEEAETYFSDVTLAYDFMKLRI